MSVLHCNQYIYIIYFSVVSQMKSCIHACALVGCQIKINPFNTPTPNLWWWLVNSKSYFYISSWTYRILALFSFFFFFFIITYSKQHVKIKYNPVCFKYCNDFHLKTSVHIHRNITQYYEKVVSWLLQYYSNVYFASKSHQSSISIISVACAIKL